jgi:hypothetical protein
MVDSRLLHALKRYTMVPALRELDVVGARSSAVRTLQGAIALALPTPRDDPDALLSFLQRKGDIGPGGPWRRRTVAAVVPVSRLRRPAYGAAGLHRR